MTRLSTITRPRILLLVLLLVVPAAAFAQDTGPVAATLKTLRATYPGSLTAVTAAELLNKTAWEHRFNGWALLGKATGNRCPMPFGGPDISCDFLIHAPTRRGWDVLIAWDEAGTPTGMTGSGEDMTDVINNGSRSIVLSVNPGEPDPPPPPPPPPPPNGDLEQLRQEVQVLTIRTANLEVDNAALRESLNGLRDFATEIDRAHRDILEGLLAEPRVIGCHASVIGISIPCRLDYSTPVTAP
jgi:hypothetical protein